MRTKPELITTIAASIFVSIAPGAGARIERVPGKAVDALTTMRLIEAVDAYCFRRAGSSSDHLELLCDISPELHVSKAKIAKRLKRSGIRLLDWNTVNRPRWPRHFDWVLIKSVSPLSKRRARITIDWDYDLDDQIIAEAIGTIYLDCRHGHWVVDQRDSKIQTGEQDAPRSSTRARCRP